MSEIMIYTCKHFRTFHLNFKKLETAKFIVILIGVAYIICFVLYVSHKEQKALWNDDKESLFYPLPVKKKNINTQTADEQKEKS